MTMSPAMRARLDAALDHVLVALRTDVKPADVIAGLVRDHKATFKPGAQTNTLRVAGIQATCTWSKDDGLLAAWRNAAMRRIMGGGRE